MGKRGEPKFAAIIAITASVIAGAVLTWTLWVGIPWLWRTF